MRKEDKFPCQNPNRNKISRKNINSCGSELYRDNTLIQKDKLTQKIQNLDAQKYRNELFDSIAKDVRSLNLQLKYNLDEVFREECIQMYDDILNSILYDNEDKKFIFFYQSFGPSNIKNANYVAVSLIIFNFARLGENIERKLLAHILDLNLSSLNRVCSTVSSHLKRIPEYNFILELINADRLTEDEYLALTNKYIDKYINYLNSRNLYEINFSEGDYEKISDSLWDIIDSIEGADKFQNFFADLKKKKPKILAAVMCFIFLKYEKNIKLSKTDFLDLLLENENFNIPRTNFTEVLHQIMLEYFVLDQDKYQQKVENYLTQYINILESYLSSDLRIDINDSIEKAMAIFDYAIVNDFPILDINKNNEIDYYFPQNFAFSLLYYTFKKMKGLENMATPMKLEQCFGSEFDFTHVNDRSGNRLYDYIADYLGRYKGQIYSRETFIKMMRKSLKEFYHIETQFLLELYQSLDMEPKEFGDKLYIHNTPGTSGVLRVIRNKTSFSDPNTFENIREFIRANHIEYYKRYFIDWINNIQELKRRDFKHQSVTYPFRWKEECLNIINNNQLKLGLYNFLNDLWRENFPRDIFMSNDNPRASMLKFYGSYDEHLKFEYIEDFFKDELKAYDSSFFLCKYVQKVFEHYKKNRIGKKPDHPPILTYIITNDNNTIAIESPVWKPIENSSLFNIGHIDIILFINGFLIIADYKQDENEIYRSLPQLTAYGILLKDRLEDYGVHINNSLLCIGFSKDMAYSFNPEDLYPKLLEFVKITNSNRNSYLLSRKIPKNSKRTYLYNDLKRLK